MEEYVEEYVICVVKNDHGVSPSPEIRERITRCRDCAYYWEEDPLGNRDACTQDIVRSPFPRRVRPDGFCAWGKPREVA